MHAIMFFMQDYRDCIHGIVGLVSKAHEDGRRYVFPSQVVARSYLEACVRSNPGIAVFNDNVVSWDQFKANFTHYPKDRAKAVYTDRLLFVNDLFSKGRAMERLRFYSDASFPESSKAYMNGIAQSLPGMCRAFDLSTMQIRPSVLENASADMVHDLGILVPAYKAFMEESPLYDPCLYEPDFSVPGNDGMPCSSYVLVFPGAYKDPCACDAMRFCPTMDVNGGFHDPGPTNALAVCNPTEDFPKLRLFPNSTAETMACMRAVHRLLANGVLPNDIAISCPNVDAYRPYIEMEALKRDIHLTFADGKPLSRYVPGRFFKALLRMRDEKYSFDSVKTFFLDPCFPFKDRPLLVEMVNQAVSCKLQDGPLSRWVKRFSAYGRMDLAEKLSLIADGISSVVDCRDASRLRENATVLVKELFGDDVWTRSLDDDDDLASDNAKVFGSCIAELGTLSLHADLVGARRNTDLFSLFVDILGDKTYAPNSRRSNVRVYGYPLDAGLAVKHHFVIGLSDSNTRLQRNPYPFLPKEKTRNLADVSQIGDYVLGLYGTVLWRDDDAENGVWLSSSEEGFCGADVIPTLFLGDGRCTKVRTVESDSYSEERRLWNGEVQSLQETTECQKTCLEAACEAAFEYSSNPVFSAPELPLCMGASMIKPFEECPYKGFARSVLKLGEAYFEPNMNDAAQIGKILHQTFQNALQESGSIGALNASRLTSIFRDVLERYSKQPDSTDAPHISFIETKYEELLPSIYESDSSQPLRDMKFVAMEKDTTSFLTHGAVRYKGEADCILEDEEGGYAIIDFKKNSQAYFSSSTLDKTSPQLAVYARMLGENPKFGSVPHYGAYYSVEDGAFKYVWPHMDVGRSKQGFEYSCTDDRPLDGSCGDRSQEFVDDNCTRRLDALSHMVEDAAFQPTPSDDVCRNCSFYNLCRGGFVTE